MTLKSKILTVLLASAFVCSCSTTIVHEPSADEPAVSDGVNINTAGIAELKRLPGIGQKTAEEIIEFRSQNGPFRRRQSLMQIRGISEERYLNIRHLVRTE